MAELRVSAQIMTLCDHANVREGLLNILSAGVTVLYRDSFPAAMGAQLAILLEVEGDFPREGVDVRMSMFDRQSNAKVVADFETQFGALDNDDGDASLPGALPLLLNLSQVPIPSEGIYRCELRVQERLLGSLNFAAMLVDTTFPDGSP